MRKPRNTPLQTLGKFPVFQNPGDATIKSHEFDVFKGLGDFHFWSKTRSYHYAAQ